MSDDTVTLVYVGPIADGTIESQYDESVYPFVRGEPIDVPAWLAFGHPGEPGQFVDADGNRRDFRRLAELETGDGGYHEVVVERIPEHQALLDQVDNWRLANTADFDRFAAWRLEHELRTFRPRRHVPDPATEQLRVDLLELDHAAAIASANAPKTAPKAKAQPKPEATDPQDGES